MKNLENKTDLEVTLDYLNTIAEMFERKLLTQIQFRYYIYGSLNYAALAFAIDRFQEKLLRDQADDIGEGKYTRFCEPTLEITNEVEHYHNEGE